MKELFRYSALLLIFSGCEQYFVPDIDSQENYIVFEGSITTEAKAHVLNVTVSLPFDNDKFYRKIAGIEAWIEDANGDIFPYHYVDTGLFITDTTVKAEIGHAYRLVAIDSAGNEYHSDFDTVFQVEEITSVYGEIDSEEKLIKNQDEGYIIKTTSGIEILLNTTLSANNCYYRYEYDMVFQSSAIIPGSSSSISYFIVRPVFSVNSSFVRAIRGSEYSGKLINGMEVVFVSQDLMEYSAGITAGAATVDVTSEGFFLRIKQHAISTHSYQFWTAVNEQLNATGQLLDPVKTQIIGNVRCVSDEDMKVFGNFEASSVSSITKFMLLKEVGSSLIIKTADPGYFPTIDTTSVSVNSIEDFPFWYHIKE